MIQNWNVAGTLRHHWTCFRKLGFVIHRLKSVLWPTHTVMYQDFEIDSMPVALMQEREERILALASKLLHHGICTVKQLEKVYWYDCG